MAKAGLWAVTDAEERKRGERTGLDTLVVHAVNDANSFLGRKLQRPSESDKLATWGVRSQE